MALPIVSRFVVYPEEKSVAEKIKLSVFDLLSLRYPYIRTGNLYQSPPFETSDLILRLKTALSRTLTYFPVLAGRFVTDDEGFVYITCGEEGADLIHVDGSSLTIKDLTESADGEWPEAVNLCFPVDPSAGFEGFSKPVLFVQVTELADGVSIAVNANHAIADALSFTNFFNSFAEVSRGLTKITRLPNFSRDSFFVSNVVPKIPSSIVPYLDVIGENGIKEKTFKFAKESIQRLKKHVNETEGNNAEISSLQCLFALLWRGIIRARKLPPSKRTTFLFAVNWRHRIEPKLDPFYFGNAIQSVKATATVKEIVENGLFWCAKKFNDIVARYDCNGVKSEVEAWERNPIVNAVEEQSDDEMVFLTYSPRFSLYEDDFGWGKPITILHRIAVKCDGMVAALPGRDGGTDFQLILTPKTMKNLETDPEFVMYLS